MSSTIVFSGIASGVDLDSIVEGLLDVERQNRIVPLENWVSEWEEKTSAIQEINSKLLSLYTLVQSMDTKGEFLVRNASSSDEDVLTASATSQASIGTHTVVINQLAKVETEVHTAGEVSEDTVVNDSGSSQTFKYRYGGATEPIITVTVPNQTTLTGLKDLINNDSNNPGVTASILYDGTDYHLVLTGNDMGASSIIEVDPDSDASLTGYTNGTFTETQAACNAEIRVDGYPPSSWITRTTNEINDVITGVSLYLKNTGTVTVNISTDKDSIKEKVNEFVDAFNEVRTIIKQYTYYDSATGEAGILNGNYATQIVKSRLDNIVTRSALGFKDGVETYINLAQIGIKTDTNESSETCGLLIIDETALNNALQNDPDAVAKLFAADFEGYSDDTAEFSYQSYIPGITKAGTYEVKAEVDGTGKLINGWFRLKGESTWRDATVNDTDKTLTGQSGNPEAGLVVRLEATGSGFHELSESANGNYIRLLQGVSGSFADELKNLTSASEGPFNVMDEHYNDIIENLEEKIDREEYRLELYEERLRESFSRLESYISQMNVLGTYLTQLALQTYQQA